MAAYTSTILFTGGTQGLGYHCTLSLARQCPQSLIIIASRRDPDNAAAANEQLKQANVKYMQLDIGTLASVRDFVKRYEETASPPISALILNAGLQLPATYNTRPIALSLTFASTTSATHSCSTCSF